MMPMRRRTSSVVIAAAPRAGGWCRWAATGTVTTASSRVRRYRITGGLEKGSEQTNAPGRGGPRPGAPALRFTPYGLRRFSSGSDRGFSFGGSRFGSTRGSLLGGGGSRRGSGRGGGGRGGGGWVGGGRIGSRA